MSSNEEKERQLTQRHACEVCNLATSLWFLNGSYRCLTEAWCLEIMSRKAKVVQFCQPLVVLGSGFGEFCVHAASYFNFILISAIVSFLTQFCCCCLRSIWLQCCHGNRLAEANNLAQGLVFRYICYPSEHGTSSKPRWHHLVSTKRAPIKYYRHLFGVFSFI